MALSVQQQRGGPDWPLGFLAVANNGTPVNIMNLVDPNNNNHPNTPSNSNTAEYTPRCTEILFQGFKPGANNTGAVNNANNVYILVPAQGNGTGNKSDYGCFVQVLAPGASFSLNPPNPGYTQLNPYRYLLDADTNGDGAFVTLIGPVGN